MDASTNTQDTSDLPASARRGGGLCLVDVAIMRGGRLLQSGISHHLAPGRMTLIKGVNGCGKSSLIRAIAGRLPLFSGQIKCDVPVIYVGHADGLSPAISGRANLGDWAALYDCPHDAKAIDTALETMEAGKFADLPVAVLSRGQRRRIALTRLALAPPGALWLLDEPNVGLDSLAARHLDAMIANHLGGGGMVLAATHLPLGQTKPAKQSTSTDLVLADPEARS